MHESECEHRLIYIVTAYAHDWAGWIDAISHSQDGSPSQAWSFGGSKRLARVRLGVVTFD